MLTSLHRLVQVSPAEFWRKYIRTPSMIPVWLTSPPGLSVLQAAQTIFPGIPAESIRAYRLDLLRNHTLFTMLNEKMVEVRERHIIFHKKYEFLYLLLRLCRPRFVIETGVLDGVSSAIILQALHDNDAGCLLSIDLPAKEPIYGSTSRMKENSLPSCRQPGWVIPAYLRQRHELLLGDSKNLLAHLLQRCPTIEVFVHDSLHSFEHQAFEYRTVWPHLSDDGLMLSDDIYWSSAFSSFCRRHKRTYVRVGGFGAIRKMHL